MIIATPLAMTLTGCGKSALPSSHSPWKTLRISHRLTASTTMNSRLTLYRGTYTGVEVHYTIRPWRSLS